MKTYFPNSKRGEWQFSKPYLKDSQFIYVSSVGVEDCCNSYETLSKT